MMRPTTPFPRRAPAAVLLAAVAVLLATGGWSQAPDPAPARDLSREQPDQFGAVWAPAATGNFQFANRPVDHPINLVVIHDIEGTAEWAVSWFQNPMAKVSAHYVIGGTGKIWQQLKERDIGYHAGNFDVNTRSVGIEHEGYAYRPGWFNRTLYEASAALVRSITARQGIPRDRTHLISHAEVPHPQDPTKFGGRSGHTDPGPFWDWDYYMALVRNDARLESVSAPAVIHPGEKLPAKVILTNLGDDPWPYPPDGSHPSPALALGQVYLGAQADHATPEPVASPFYDLESWVGPRYAASGQGSETAPGQAATLAFTLQGPRTFGTASERFRLVKVPVMPQQPVPFGPSITLRTRVEPWSLVRGTEAPGFTAPGWSEKTVQGRRVYSMIARSREAQPARWTVPLPIDGRWRISARVPAGPGRAHRLLYQVAAADGPHRVAVAIGRGGWRPLGAFRFEGPKPQAAIELQGAGQPGIVTADQLRFEGPYPG